MNHSQNHIDATGVTGTPEAPGLADSAGPAPELIGLLNLPDANVDVKAIERRTLKRIASDGATSGKSRRFAPLRSKALLLAAVIAVLIVGTGSAFAVNALLNYSYPQSYYDEPKSYGELGVPAGAPTFYGIQTPNLEDYSFAVGQRLEAEGVAVTLDTIATDGNIVTALLTYEFDEPVVLTDVVSKGHDPLDAVSVFTSQPKVSVDGQELPNDPAAASLGGAKDSQAYFADEEQRVIKKAVQYLIPFTTSSSLEVSVAVEPFTNGRVLVSAVPETMTFSPVTIDISAALSQTVSAEPGQYRFVIDGVERTLDLEKLAVGPLGSVISAHVHFDDSERNPAWSRSDERNIAYLDLRDFLVVDQNGTALAVVTPWSVMQGELHAGYISADRSSVEALTKESGITELRIVPPASNEIVEARHYSVDDIGATIEIMPGGGLYLRDYRVESSSLIFEAEAYGVARERGFLGEDESKGRSVGEEASEARLDNPEFSFDEGPIPPQELLGRIHSSYDEATGIYTFRIDFYTATEELLSQITTFSVVYFPGVVAYDYDQAYTLPLRVAG